MGSFRQREKYIESAISIGILVLLFLIAIGVFIKQFDYDLSRFGMEVSKEIDLRSLVPVGFDTLSKIGVYNSENLYEKINGKAPLYIESGFEKLYTLRFISKDVESLWMELFVYDMADIRNAFSVYSVQKRADVQLLPDMLFAYWTANATYFVHGKYYIELVGSAESAELSKAIEEVVRKIISELAIDKTAEIAELTLFPQENLVPGSSRLYLGGAFGFEGLTDTFAARYNIDGESITAFLSKRSDTGDARTIAKNYYNFLIDNGGKFKPTANDTLKHLQAKVVDFYGTTEVVFAVGPFVAGIHEAENQLFAETLTVMLINKLGKAMNND